MSEAQNTPFAPGTTGVLKAMVAITAVMAGEGISKDRKNQQQGYNFRGIDDVLNALSRLYAEHQIVILPSYSNRVITERESQKGGALFNVVLEGRYRVMHVDGSSIECGPFIGEAMDSADKATNKAMSASYKYFAIQTFSIPTEGDNDADTTTHEVKGKGKAPAPAPKSAQPAPTLNEQDFLTTIADITNGDGWENTKASIFNACSAVGATEVWDRMKDKLKEKAKAIGYTPKQKTKANGTSNGTATAGH